MKSTKMINKWLSFLQICAFSITTLLFLSGCQLKANAPVFAGLELDQPLHLPVCDSMGGNVGERTASPIPCARIVKEGQEV